MEMEEVSLRFVGLDFGLSLAELSLSLLCVWYTFGLSLVCVWSTVAGENWTVGIFNRLWERLQNSLGNHYLEFTTFYGNGYL